MRAFERIVLPIFLLVILADPSRIYGLGQVAHDENLNSAAVSATPVQLVASHGTVNILLANGNGLSVLTDSRLSDDQGRPLPGEAQKLFKIDSHTICTVAGWYSNPGPRSNSIGERTISQFPALLRVPQLIDEFLSFADLDSQSLNRKVDLLTQLFAVAMLDQAYVDFVSGTEPNVSNSELTVAGYDNETLSIVQVNLVPQIVDGRILGYDVQKFPPQEVRPNGHLIWVVRGITELSKPILEGTNTSDPFLIELISRNANDPSLIRLRQSLVADGGASLSLKEMRRIAERLEAITSAAFPGLVGDNLQIAELSNRSVSAFVQPLSPENLPRRTTSTGIEGLRIEGPGLIMNAGSRNVALAHDLEFQDAAQPIDNVFYYRSRFDRCQLTFSGSPRTIFDKSNILTDSSLTLIGKADANSPFVKQLRMDFPKLEIIDKTRHLVRP